MSENNNNNLNDFNERYGDLDLKRLMELLERLEKREENRRRGENFQAFTNPEPVELVSMETAEAPDPEENLRLIPDSFEPVALSEEAIQDLLIEEPVVSEPRRFTMPTIRLSRDRQEEPEDEELPPPPASRRNPFKVLWVGFCNHLPRKEDSTGTKVRKCGFLTSLLVMLVAIIYLLVDLVIIPARNERLKQELIALYRPDLSNTIVTPEEAKKGNYPAKMLASFKGLYDRNSDVSGWISFHADGKKDFLNIEYPIMYRNEPSNKNIYLKVDYDRKKNRNGTLFFDQKNQVRKYTDIIDPDVNRSLIVYGHNMASGQMFAGLNKLMSSTGNARAAATFTMSSLFRVDEYQVFAVILVDESDKPSRRFNAWRTEFSSDADFLRYVQMMKDRSMFDYPVDVQANDQIVVLSTCTGRRSAHVKDGRLLVVARRVKEGDDPVKTSEISKNKNVIMPYYWYINQNKTPHKSYIQSGQHDATTTAPSGTDSTATDATGGTVTEPSGSTDSSESTPSESDPSKSEPSESKPSESKPSESKPSESKPSGSKPSESKPSHEHTYDNACDTQCDCGVTREVGGHVYDSCEDTECNECKATREAKEHTYDSCEDTECNQCKATREAKEHTYGEDGVCTACKQKKPEKPEGTE